MLSRRTNTVSFCLDDLNINKNSGRTPYRRRTNEEKMSIHWGQRKLLMSEIQFFTLYWDPKVIPNPLCVYAGAASGVHIGILSKMFPSFTFHLYDPSKFEIKETDKIKIFTGPDQGYFTDEVAQKYAGRNDIFFISDIRTSGHKSTYDEFYAKNNITEFDIEGEPLLSKYDIQFIKKVQREAENALEDRIANSDMKWQENWVKIMNPEHARKSVV